MSNPQQASREIPAPQLPPFSFESILVAEIDIENNTFSKTSFSTVCEANEEISDSGRTTGSTLIPQDNPSDTSGRSWCPRWFLEWWMMEILSCFFGLVCMMDSLVVLLRYNGKTDPKWKIGLSVGSFISILYGFVKSALLLPTAELVHIQAHLS